MHPRINYSKAAPGVYDAMDALDHYLAASSLDRRLLYLVQLRASQLNGCAYCIDMHWKDLRVLDETEHAEILPVHVDAVRASVELRRAKLHEVQQAAIEAGSREVVV